ncbi:DUF6191 domain-containing protein [Cellulomonas triticagri]|uniref:Uncharacterized protein n=1 Tax=Cellulomonas triticagri TaxID=2483352 RepID=A0A3M2IXB1_9CELL|nr:DUF6191 domain-containing protein [Cellulomonas triticagri]RMI06547.1 hypothetical protein EBM89_16090 [Cellulomonas triticagri]
MDVTGWVVVGAAVVVGLVVLDRLVAHGVLDRRRPRPRAPRPEGGSGASGALGELIDVFQPSNTHVTEERERQRHDRQHAGDAAPPVDLDANTAHLDPPTR